MAIAAPNYAQIYRQSQLQEQKAITPTLTAMQGEKQPLLDRYQGVLDQITANQQSALTGSDRASSQEFERRGILGGGIVENTLEERRNPIRQQYAGLFAETGAEREQSLAALMSRIAGVQTGANQAAIQGAQSLYGTKYGGYQSALDRALQASQAAKNRQFQASQSALDRAAQLSTASANNPAPFPIPTGTTGNAKISQANYVQDLYKNLQGWLSGKSNKGANFLDFVESYASVLPLRSIYAAYNQQAGSKWGAPKESRSEVEKVYYGAGGR